MPRADAFRRHRQRQMIAGSMGVPANWVDFPHNRQLCSCWMCGNPRRHAHSDERLTAADRRAPYAFEVAAEELDKAIAAIKDAAESEQARDIAAKAKATATTLAHKAKDGALSAADTFVEANRDPSSMTVRYLAADLTVLSPSEGISVTKPDAATLVIADGQDNGLVINAAADPAVVVEMIGTVARLSGNTYDLGAEDGINVVVTKF